MTRTLTSSSETAPATPADTFREREPARRAVAPAPIDPRGPRFNQAVLVFGLVAAFVFSQPWVVVGLLVVLGAGAIFGSRYGLFLQIYARLIKPRLGPPADVEDPRPPRFAALVGSVFLGGAALAFALGAAIVGWVLALVVAALAGLAAVSGICIGCEVYTLLARTGLIKPKAPILGESHG